MTTDSYNVVAVKAVGIKELKAKLSEFIRLAKSGETILVTDRNDIVAEIRPPRNRGKRPETPEDILEAWVESGLVTRAQIPKEPGWTWKVKGLGMDPKEVDKLLDDVRADRFEL